MLATLIAAAPSIYKLFTSDDKDEAIKDLTGQVVKSAADALGIEATRKEEIVEYVSANPEAAYKLKKLEQDFELRIKELDLESSKLQLQDKQASVEVFKESHTIQENLVKHINLQFYFVVVLGIVTLFATAYFIEDKGLAMAISGFVSGLITLVTNRVMAVDGFFFGSSIGSKEKDKKAFNLK